MATYLDPIHPGEILQEDFLQPMGISINRLAREIGVPPGRISTIVDRYAVDFLENSVSQIAKNSISDALDRERLRKLQIENDKKEGELVSIKRRVLVIQGMKAAMINGKATFINSMRDNMRLRHPDSEGLNDMLLNSADLYENAVLEMFDDIERRGRV